MTSVHCPECGRPVVRVSRPAGWQAFVTCRISAWIGHSHGLPETRERNPNRSGTIEHTDGTACYTDDVDAVFEALL